MIKMNISCILCDRQIDTKNEDVIVTVNWVYSELIKRNNIQLSKNLPRVVKICKICWENIIKDKPQGNNYYWLFSKAI
jgi:hypothetical protein